MGKKNMNHLHLNVEVQSQNKRKQAENDENYEKWGWNVLSLFDGISCGRLALERAGIEVNKYYASEIDKYAIKITQSNYPDTIQLGDVREQ